MTEKGRVLRLRYREICDEEMAGHYDAIIYDEDEAKTKSNNNLGKRIRYQIENSAVKLLC